MNNYIVLNSKRYRTASKNWTPKAMIPSTINFNLDGTLDATFGPATVYVFDGAIMVQPTANSPWGTANDLEAALSSRAVLNMTDHFGVTYSVVSNGFVKQSLSNVWDDSNNWLMYIVQLIGRKTS